MLANAAVRRNVARLADAAKMKRMAAVKRPTKNAAKAKAAAAVKLWSTK